MGLNYYWEGGAHIGKSSYGWKFGFHKNPGLYDSNIVSFTKFLVSTDIQVIDEYYHIVDKYEFMTKILSKQKDLTHEEGGLPDEYGFDWIDGDYV